MDVTLYPGPAIDEGWGEVRESAVRVLERLGCTVTLPDERPDYGQDLLFQGDVEGACAQMGRFLDAYADADQVVSLSGNAVCACKRQFARLLMGTPGGKRLTGLNRRLREFSEFIVDVLGVTDAGASLAGTATLHQSCQMTQVLGLRSQAPALLSHVGGLTFVPMEAPERCCGFGGPFHERQPELSACMAAEKLACARATGADYLVGCEASCLLNLKGHLGADDHVSVLHLAQVLDNPKEA